jgi:hypothetical protein
MAPKIKEEWICRGILSACECFGCENKVSYKLRGDKVYVLCRNPCNFRPITGEALPTSKGLQDIERTSGLMETKLRRRRETGFSGGKNFI